MQECTSSINEKLKLLYGIVAYMKTLRFICPTCKTEQSIVEIRDRAKFEGHELPWLKFDFLNVVLTCGHVAIINNLESNVMDERQPGLTTRTGHVKRYHLWRHLSFEERLNYIPQYLYDEKAWKRRAKKFPHRQSFEEYYYGLFSHNASLSGRSRRGIP
jgi:hypothetical protein